MKLAVRTACVESVVSIVCTAVQTRNHRKARLPWGFPCRRRCVFGLTASTPHMARMASVAERQLTARQSPTPDGQQSAPKPSLPRVGQMEAFVLWTECLDRHDATEIER